MPVPPAEAIQHDLKETARSRHLRPVDDDCAKVRTSLAVLSESHRVERSKESRRLGHAHAFPHQGSRALPGELESLKRGERLEDACPGVRQTFRTLVVSRDAQPRHWSPFKDSRELVEAKVELRLPILDSRPVSFARHAEHDGTATSFARGGMSLEGVVGLAHEELDRDTGREHRQHLGAVRWKHGCDRGEYPVVGKVVHEIFDLRLCKDRDCTCGRKAEVCEEQRDVDGESLSKDEF